MFIFVHKKHTTNKYLGRKEYIFFGWTAIMATVQKLKKKKKLVWPSRPALSFSSYKGTNYSGSPKTRPVTIHTQWGQAKHKLRAAKNYAAQCVFLKTARTHDANKQRGLQASAKTTSRGPVCEHSVNSNSHNNNIGNHLPVSPLNHARPTKEL